MGIDSMLVTVTMLPGNTTEKVELQQNATIVDLLLKLEIKPDTVVVLREKTPIPIDETINKEENLTLIQVASGG